MKKLVGLLIVLLFGIGGYLAYRKWFAPSQKTRFITNAVEKGDITQVVNATGTLQPVVLSPVGAQVSGIVWKIHSDYNGIVKKGQVLVELDPALFQVAVKQQEANVAAARAEVESAKASFHQAHIEAFRTRELEKQNFVSKADQDAANAKEAVSMANLSSAKAKFHLAQAALAKARLDLKNSVVLSPVDGIVISRDVELGQAIVASFQAPHLFTIAESLQKMQVLANVDEADIGMIKLGATANFTVDSFRGRNFTAQVAQIRNAPQTLQNVVTYVVVLEVDNTELLLRPGMTANVKIEVAQRKGVFLIPNPSLRFKPRPEELNPSLEKKSIAEKNKVTWKDKRDGKDQRDKGANLRTTVYLLEGDNIKPVPIVIGITDGNQTEVKEGLQEGQAVITDAMRPFSSRSTEGMATPGMGGGRRAGF